MARRAVVENDVALDIEVDLAHRGAVARTRNRSGVIVVLVRVEIDRRKFEVAWRRVGDRVQLSVLQKHPAATRTGLDIRMTNGFQLEGCGITRTVHGTSRSAAAKYDAKQNARGAMPRALLYSVALISSDVRGCCRCGRRRRL